MKQKDPPEDPGLNIALLANLKAREGGGELDCQRCGLAIRKDVGTNRVRYYWLTVLGPTPGVNLIVCPSCAEKLRILSTAMYAMLSDGERKVSVTFTPVGQGKRKTR